MHSFVPFFLTLGIGLIGWMAWHALLNPQPSTDESIPKAIRIGFGRCFIIFLAGVACISFAVFVLAHLGIFNVAGLSVACSILSILYLIKASKRGFRNFQVQLFRQYLTFLTFFACLTFALGWLAPPYEAVLVSSDATIYLGAAYHLADAGDLKHEDRLLQEMTPREREVFFLNRFPADQTGKFARFPGGIPLLDPTRSEVTFYFYHLLPTWLGLGLILFGDEGFLKLMTLFLALGLTSIYYLTRQFGGWLLGCALCVLLLSFYPQLYFASLPSSEMLSQALFLAGLAIFIALLSLQHPSPNLQVLVGALWGALFLCRIDAILFICVCLIVVFSFSLPHSQLRTWLPFFQSLFFSLSLALFHQLSNGVYMSLPAHTAFNISWLLSSLSRLLIDHELLGRLMFLGFLLFSHFLFSIGRTWQIAGQSGLATLRYFLPLLTLLLLAMTLRYDWSKIVRNLQWMVLYIPPWSMAILLCGFVWSCCRLAVRGGNVGMRCLLAFFLVPTIYYLIDSKVFPTQPWAIRRFVPIVFPLFFLISLTGWLDGLKWRWGGHRRFYAGAFVAAVIAITVPLYSDSFALRQQPLFQGVIAQARKLAERVPDDALIIIPDSLAGYGAQVLIQYIIKRDTLLLPLENDLDNDLTQMSLNYIKRQLDHGKKVLLLTKPDAVYPLLVNGQFSLRIMLADAISFSCVIWVASDQFPNRTETLEYPFLFFKLEPMLKEATAIAIDVGDPTQDVPFILKGVYYPEREPSFPYRPFRWTRPEAKFLLPVADLITIIADVPQAQSFGLSIGAIDNEVRQTTKFHDIDRGPVVITTPVPKELRERESRIEVAIASEPFSPRELGINDDSRQLGIRLRTIIVQSLPPDELYLPIGARRIYGIQESGFHAQEWEDERPYRWTNGKAALLVPLSKDNPPRFLSVDLYAGRPDGTTVSILFNGNQLIEARLPVGEWMQTLELPAGFSGEQGYLEILSDTYVPENVLVGSKDHRELGVRVKSLKFLSRAYESRDPSNPQQDNGKADRR